MMNLTQTRWNRLTRSIPGLRFVCGWFAKRSLPVCFSVIVLRSFAPSQDTFEKSPKRTTVIWGACERKSRSRACRRSNVGLPIYLYPSLMQSTVLQIFIKVLNITFFPSTLHSLRFMIHAKTKPNNGLSGVAFSWASFDIWRTNHINFARFHVQIINKWKI